MPSLLFYCLVDLVGLVSPPPQVIAHKMYIHLKWSIEASCWAVIDLGINRFRYVFVHNWTASFRWSTCCDHLVRLTFPTFCVVVTIFFIIIIGHCHLPPPSPPPPPASALGHIHTFHTLRVWINLLESAHFAFFPFFCFLALHSSLLISTTVPVL